jgi:hypothetical protein
MNAIQTKHNLDFEAAPWECIGSIDDNFARFRIGTCEGLWATTERSFDILAVINDDPGNGHLIDTLEWFSHACKRDKKDLRILELWNKPFKEHLIKKHGFKKEGKDNLIKKFKDL